MSGCILYTMNGSLHGGDKHIVRICISFTGWEVSSFLLSSSEKTLHVSFPGFEHMPIQQHHENAESPEPFNGSNWEVLCFHGQSKNFEGSQGRFFTHHCLPEWVPVSGLGVVGFCA